MDIYVWLYARARKIHIQNAIYEIRIDVNDRNNGV